VRRVPDALRFAHGLLRERKYDLAADEYERFLAAGPQDPNRLDAEFGLATARLYQGRYPDSRKAFEAFLKGARDDPRTVTAHYRLGELCYLTADLAAARRELESFLGSKAEHPGQATAWTYLADVCFGLNDLPAARRAYDQSLSAFPRGRLADRAKYGLGRTLAAQGETNRALEVLHELAARGSPEWVDRAWLQIGAVHQSAGQHAEVVTAMAALERAAPQSALRHEARLRRAQALKRLGRTAEAESLLSALAGEPSAAVAAQAALELATIELEQNRPDVALATLDRAIGRSPGSGMRAALEFRAAEALRQQNRLSEAEARFLRAIEAEPGASWADDAMRRAALTALERRDARAARRLAGQFSLRFPRSPLRGEVGLIEARAAVMAGETKAAADILEALLDPGHQSKGGPTNSLDPALAERAQYELALAYRALGRTADADGVLAHLSETTGGAVAASAQFLLGQSHVEAGRFAEAVAPLEKYLAKNPQGDVAEFALADLAVAQLGAGRMDDSWKTLANLAARFPQSKALPPARLRLAEAALAAHQASRAAEQFRILAGTSADGGMEPHDPAAPSSKPADRALKARALAGLGRALRELGKPAEASSALGAALELAPDDASAAGLALARAKALEAGEKPDQALEAYALTSERFAKTIQSPLAALARARLLVKLGRHTDGAAAFERLVSDSRATEMLSSAGVPVDALLAEWGWSLVDAAKPAEADRVFARLLKDYAESPHAADARFNLAESANQARNFPEVIRLLTALATKTPVEPDTSASAVESAPARKSERTGNPNGSHASRLLPAALYRLGRTQIEVRDWVGAAATLDRLVSEFPTNPYRREARLMKAESALQSGDAAGAEAALAALRAEPVSATDPPGFIRAVRVKQLHCWVALKRWKEVLSGVQALRPEVAGDDPVIAELDYARGQALLGLGRLDEARGAFQAVIDARREGELAAQAQLMRGETFFHQGQLHEALREFLRVDILYDAPRWQAAALLEAGKVYEGLDQWADAAETYGRLLARFPGDPSAASARARRDAASRRAAGGESGRIPADQRKGSPGSPAANSG
jgi:TolA-binding protein